MLQATDVPISDLKQKKKVHRAWAMYDWANSAYNLVITSTIFPAYYTFITTVRENDQIVDDRVSFFGAQVKNSALFDYTLAVAYLIIALISPILSSIADYTGRKKLFLKFFCYLGAFSCCGLYFFTKETVEISMILFGLAAVGFCGSLVFYNAYLPEIAAPEEQDRLSARGFAYGYIGSVILQIICFVFVMMPDKFGITDGGFPPRLSFLLVGIWWMVWAQIPFLRLPKGQPLYTKKSGSLLTNGFYELKKVWHQVRAMPVMKTYLAAFLMYSMGVQTVMLAATIFGSKELNLPTESLIATILIIQLVAIAGAYLMARLSERWGNLKVLLMVVLIWIGICIAAYYTTTAIQFYCLATVVGLVMGGIQSLSRSTFAKMIPPTRDTASFFSFYDVTEKVAIVIGMFSFGYIDHILSMRHSIFALVVFFAAGALILYLAIRRSTKNPMAQSI